jgi:glycosyltransferase involved in cell wall biosynthesis
VILSVVIPTRDKRALLERTLQALRAQQPGMDAWQIVVVNDGSRDDTGRLLAAIAAAEPRLQIVAPPKNVGRAAARNLGWRRATGRWILFLDDDILAPPGLLRAHLDLLAAGEFYGTVGPAVTDPAIVDAPHFHYLDSRGVAKLPPGPAPAKYFVTQNAAVPRQALEQVGGFDEAYAAYGFEDMDLGFRLENAGVRFQVVPAPIPLHLHHHDLAGYLEKKRICGESSLAQIARRHPERLGEMRLHWILAPGNRAPSPRQRLVRGLLRGPFGTLAAAAVRRWPHGAFRRPVAPAVYSRCMDVAVFRAYCHGLSDAEARAVNMAHIAP